MNILEWAASAQPGDTFSYARGNLAYLRNERSKAQRADTAASVMLGIMCDAASDAWRLYGQGTVTLVQRRLGFDDYEYLAVRLRARA